MNMAGHAHPGPGGGAFVRACLVVLALAAILAAATPIHATTSSTIIYVVPGGTGGGASWADGKDLAAALSGAASGDELWVKAGTYKPTTGTDRTATFALKSGVAIYGGFAGTETALSQRNWRTNVTMLSGDLNGDDGANFANNGDNSYHVVTAIGTDNTAILDGFTVTGGNAINRSTPYSCPNNCGGGLYVEGGSPTLSHLTISHNSADSYGGGVYSKEAAPTLTNVVLAGNRNTRGEGGGGMTNFGSDSTLTNVVFSGNAAQGGYGGGLMNSGCNPTLTNVTFNGNAAEAGAAAMYNLGSNPKIRNSILWGDAPGEIDGHGSTPDVTYSIVQQAAGVYPGDGNLNADPRFMTPVNPAAAPTTSGNLRLQTGSPAYNRGANGVTNPSLPPTDLDGVARIMFGVVDMGAYEIGYGVSYVSPTVAAPSVNTLYAMSIGTTRTPVKWKLTDAAGTLVTAAGTVTGIATKPTSCSNFTTDPTGATAAAIDGTNPKYDTLQKAWVYNWLLPGRGCYTLFMTLNGGQRLILRYNIH